MTLTTKKIEKTIFPVGFYRTKAKVIREICRTLIQDYSGKVPNEIDELLKLKGVGRKTANLVVTLGYRKPGICVDTHVHRISNRWGYVKTATPEKTEFALQGQASKTILDRIQRPLGQLRPASLPSDLARLQPVSRGKVLR